MITEDYVSFETAKLLKEKGFYQDFYNSLIPVWHYNGNKKVLSFTEDDGYPSETQEWYSAPTLQMAMKWLRTKYKLHINPCYTIEDGEPTGEWHCFVKFLVGRVYPLDSNHVGENYASYEEACEEAIKYCLENLI